MQFENKKITAETKKYWFVLLFFSIGILFLIDFLLERSDYSSINNKQFFGNVGTNIIAIVVSLILLALYSYFLVKKKLFFSGWLVLVGATTNILDRIFFGGVPDYIQVLFIPKFNLADLAIVLGFVWLTTLLIIDTKKHHLA